MEQTSKRYAKSLKGSPAHRYLVEERGLTDETIERFSLGYVDDPLPGHETYRGCISIPYLTPDASVVSVRFRRLDNDGPKYLTTPGDMPRLYNTSALVIPFAKICVTEGEIDAATAEQDGLPAVGVPGANSWQKVWNLLFRQYDVVYVLVDDDKAGAEFGATIARGLETARIITMDGGDVNSYRREHGSGSIKEKINGSAL
ncbi:toprim domain-containing protein [Nonomuraea sp. NPDC049141]|uniref:toprim domain-containing protein n=1 Tax=Nonomuraea sp. NPDC049141 TaxID=3155500 RepID=UPI0033E0C7D5